MTDPEREPTLRVLTFPTPTEPTPHVDSYICQCGACDLERGQLIALGSRDRHQPWSQAA